MELLVIGLRNVEDGKRGGNIEEEGSERQVLSGTGPANNKPDVSVHPWGSPERRETEACPYLLPDPNIIPSGSLEGISSFPSFRNRSGS